ncbi:MAG: pirin family protein [Rickettsiales bacterium]|nr:pirin family protein [Rickettsiales bacterium]
MAKIFRFSDLGKADYGWLKANYHFSFANYYNPNRTGFGKLLVINDDKVSAGKGFAPHSHKDMEIITYVRSGAITHQDSLGNKGRTIAGDVQVMSAGSGITHSEYNYETEDTTLFQIWIQPNEMGVKPRWDARKFPKEISENSLTLLVSGRKEDEHLSPLFIYQDAAIWGGNLKANSLVNHKVKYNSYILASKGEFEINGQKMQQGDGAEVKEAKEIQIKTFTDSEIIVIDTP